MLPAGSIWEWTTDGSIGIVVSEPIKKKNEYGFEYSVNDVYFITDDPRFMEILVNTLDGMAENGTIIRLDGEAEDG